MIWLLLLVVVAVVGIGGLAMFFAIGSVAADERGRKAALANRDVLLDGAFDGSKHVTFAVGPRTLPFDAVVVGAEERGYRLLSQADEPGGRKTLVFKRTKAASADPARSPRA